MKKAYLLFCFLCLSKVVLGFDPRIASLHCGLHYQKPIKLSGKIKASEIKELKFATFNLENFGYEKKFRFKKSKDELNALSKMILDQDLDIIVMQEVESLESLAEFNHAYLNGRYSEIALGSSDQREIAFLVKKDLPFQINYQSHRELKWRDPFDPSAGDKNLFIRDLPALHIRLLGKSMTEAPDLILMGVHYKSQIDRGLDLGSKVLRNEEVKRTVDVINFYKETYQNKSKIILAGDFNSDLQNASEFRQLFSEGKMKDSFDVLKVSNEERITHSFHPEGGKTEYAQIDGVLINDELEGALLDSKVYRYRDELGQDLPIPRTYEERSKNFSDHFMIRSIFDFRKIFH